ncbi:MAG: hypothetical protein JSV05_08145 [Candidatus Bathyarchaeota archaeon]|nr:MAG: hypothetical protein JSV05_08145 [Candidatus Bathyarchaeota archaeon]
MPARKMRVDVFDESGNRYTITFEGKVTREKALRLFEIVELLGGVHHKNDFKYETASFSKIDKTKLAIEEELPFGWFSSKELLAIYERKYNEPISLSTISTYLARLTDRGILIRKGLANNRNYRKNARLTSQALGIINDK